jgi:hypothetical protein
MGNLDKRGYIMALFIYNLGKVIGKHFIILLRNIL